MPVAEGVLQAFVCTRWDQGDLASPAETLDHITRNRKRLLLPFHPRASYSEPTVVRQIPKSSDGSRGGMNAVRADLCLAHLEKGVVCV